MPIPSTAQQLLITLLLVIPGFVYQQVRIRFRGRLPADIDLSNRVLRAIATSTVFALMYVAVASFAFPSYDQARDWALAHPTLTTLAAFCAAFAVPAVVALSAASSRGQQLTAWTDAKLPATGYDTRPAAWDVAFQGIQPSFVRVRMKDGTWFAGYFGTSSYASSYPDPRSLYLELSYRVKPDGTIEEPIEGSRGAAIDCTEAVLLEIIATPNPDDEAQSP